MSQRADRFLVAHGYASTRAEALAAIKAGRVSADGKPVAKASQTLREGQAIAYAKEHPYVSRGALKLAAALDHFDLSPQNLISLDIGASTGGFTQVLLERGAAKVYALDVGHGQMHPDVRTDPRVIALEGVNARELARAQVPEVPMAIVADVSFISLKLVLPPALALAGPGAWLVALVKPQFEAGRAAIGKGGIVKDDAARAAAVTGICTWIATQPGWRVLGRIESPILGGDGNREYLAAAVKS